MPERLVFLSSSPGQRYRLPRWSQRLSAHSWHQ